MYSYNRNKNKKTRKQENKIEKKRNCFFVFLFSCFNEKGFTLIEVLLSIAIITTVFFALINVFPYSLTVSKKAQNLTTATYLAQAGAEHVLSFSYDDLGIDTVEPKARLSDDENSFLYNFYRETEVSYVDENLASSVVDIGLKKVEVTVFWYNPFSAQEKSYVLATLVSRK